MMPEIAFAYEPWRNGVGFWRAKSYGAALIWVGPIVLGVEWDPPAHWRKA